MAKKRQTADELAFMPRWLRWVSDHPLLHVAAEDMGAKERKIEREYLEEHPCPSQFSQNLFNQYRGSTVRLEKLFLRVSNHWAASARKKANELASEEDVAIADLEVAKAAALGTIKV
jgi:hypothetical protein